MNGFIRIGTVTARDESAYKIRMIDRETGVTSDWLYCLQRRFPITVEEADQHIHKIHQGLWLPEINVTVLAVFIPVPDGDGFVIGEVG